MWNLPDHQRGPQGSLIASDPRRRPEDVLARAVQATTRGRWLCWFGRATRRYWAMAPRSYPWSGLLESDTPEGLAAAIGQVELFYGPAS
ncbi:hypothetical protein Acsp04_48060 [Actinomadura sp. NBRC 104425]|nr:hypothetical protein Acsp04_48060 [Actinomadura sp. NBRC 104425]